MALNLDTPFDPSKPEEEDLLPQATLPPEASAGIPEDVPVDTESLTDTTDTTDPALELLRRRQEERLTLNSQQENTIEDTIEETIEDTSGQTTAAASVEEPVEQAPIDTPEIPQLDAELAAEENKGFRAVPWEGSSESQTAEDFDRNRTITSVPYDSTSQDREAASERAQIDKWKAEFTSDITPYQEIPAQYRDQVFAEVYGKQQADVVSDSLTTMEYIEENGGFTESTLQPNRPPHPASPFRRISFTPDFGNVMSPRSVRITTSESVSFWIVPRKTAPDLSSTSSANAGAAANRTDTHTRTASG